MAQIKRLGVPFTSLREKHQQIGKISNIFFSLEKRKFFLAYSKVFLCQKVELGFIKSYRTVNYTVRAIKVHLGPSIVKYSFVTVVNSLYPLIDTS